MKSDNKDIDKKRSTVRMIDIAKLAGVSRIAVSQVLNPRPGSRVRVSDDTRKKILSLAQTMNYRPNRIAQQLSGGAAGLIGFIIDSGSYATWTNCMARAAEELFTQGYRLQVGLLHDDLKQMENHLDDFASRQLDGVICASHTYLKFGEKIPQLLSRFKNRIFIQEPIGSHHSSFVAPDIVSGIHLLSDHLLRMERKRIALLLGEITDYSAVRLAEAFRKRIKEVGDAKSSAIVVDCPMEYPADSHKGAQVLVDAAMKSKPDALIAGSDYTAMWVMKVLEERGIKVPEDIAVVSNLHTNVGLAWPEPITAIDYHYDQIGKRAGQIMLSLLGDPAERIVEHYVAPELILGSSCGYKI